MPKRPGFNSVDEYISSFPEEIQEKLNEMRAIFKNTVPQAEETISYQIPTYKLNGKYIGYFAGFKSHVSFYPIPKADHELEKEFAPYVHGKGTLRFSLDKPLPKKLISKLIKRWVEIRQNK